MVSRQDIARAYDDHLGRDWMARKNRRHWERTRWVRENFGADQVVKLQRERDAKRGKVAAKRAVKDAAFQAALKEARKKEKAKEQKAAAKAARKEAVRQGAIRTAERKAAQAGKKKGGWW